MKKLTLTPPWRHRMLALMVCSFVWLAACAPGSSVAQMTADTYRSPSKDSTMKIRLIVGEQVATATLYRVPIHAVCCRWARLMMARPSCPGLPLTRCVSSASSPESFSVIAVRIKGISIMTKTVDTSSAGSQEVGRRTLLKTTAIGIVAMGVRPSQPVQRMRKLNQT